MEMDHGKLTMKNRQWEINKGKWFIGNGQRKIDQEKLRIRKWKMGNIYLARDNRKITMGNEQLDKDRGKWRIKNKQYKIANMKWTMGNRQ